MKDSGAGGVDGAATGTLGADVISVMMGYKHASAHLSASSYRTFMEAFVAKVGQVDGAVPIYVISPLYTSNAGSHARMLEYREEIMRSLSG